jgi:hypothetical protein
LLTIEALNGRVLVRVVGVATDSIREQIAAYEADWEEWWQQHGKAQEVRPPRSVGERIFDSLTVRVVDDRSTEFRWVSGNSGGSGVELLCEWLFEPGIPSEATSVTVVVTTADGAESSVTVDAGHLTPALPGRQLAGPSAGQTGTPNTVTTGHERSRTQDFD